MEELMIKYKKYYAFIYRADTIQKCIIAEQWIKAHADIFCRAVFDDLILTLDQIRAILFKRKMQKEMNKILKENQLCVD